METICPKCNAVTSAPEALSRAGLPIRCHRCNALLSTEPGSAPSPMVAAAAKKRAETERFMEMLAVFIGDKSDIYLARFRKFDPGGEDRFAATWNWPASIFVSFWFLYRKMYLWAVITLITSLIPVVSILTVIFSGVCGNYLYYRHARKKIAALGATATAGELDSLLARAGGVHRWVIVAGIVFGAALVIALVAAVRMLPGNLGI
jgi:hypothetical protein